MLGADSPVALWTSAGDEGAWSQSEHWPDSMRAWFGEPEGGVQPFGRPCWQEGCGVQERVERFNAREVE